MGFSQGALNILYLLFICQHQKLCEYTPCGQIARLTVIMDIIAGKYPAKYCKPDKDTLQTLQFKRDGKKSNWDTRELLFDYQSYFVNLMVLVMFYENRDMQGADKQVYGSVYFTWVDAKTKKPRRGRITNLLVPIEEKGCYMQLDKTNPMYSALKIYLKCEVSNVSLKA